MKEMSKVICSTNAKGGIANTTTSVNMAFWLSQNWGPTLLADFDRQGDDAKMLGAQGGPHSARFLARMLKLDEALVQTGFENLFLMPGNGRIAGMETNIAQLIAQEETPEDKNDVRQSYARMLIEAAEDFSAMVIDPPKFGEIQTISIMACDVLVVPTRLDPLSRMNALGMIKVAHSMMPDHATIHVLPVALDARQKRANQAIVDWMREEVSAVGRVVKVYEGIPSSVDVPHSMEAGLPVLKYSPRSGVSKAYEKFFLEMLGV